MKNLFGGIYHNRNVLITGHTGFKGSWLALWLKEMSANILGYALEPPTQPNHFELLNLNINSIIDEIRNKEKLENVFREFQPEIVFHLAAQPLVRESYIDPVGTYGTNVMGTVNVLEACRKTKTVKAIINVTSDKCYENKEWVWGYRENEPMGGYDPYSSSKGCSELITAAYRRSFFNLNEFGKSHNTLLASARAGNVIGGGDWAKDRLIPDIMKAAAINEEVTIRNPDSTRPWQHVLEPLSGYLLLGQRLLEKKKEFADAWNFGPNKEETITVREVVKNIKNIWSKINYEISQSGQDLHEANLLKLDYSKAFSKLKWEPIWSKDKSIESTIKWYRNFYENNNILSLEDIANYVHAANNKNIEWAK